MHLVAATKFSVATTMRMATTNTLN